ncbi:MAG: thioredoxin [Candidatus Aminicenantales bacterium]
MSDNVPFVNDADFEAEVLKSELPVLVDFSAVWCVPCKIMAPIVDGLAVEMGGRIKVRQMDVDANPRTPATYGIRGIPTLLIFKGGDMKESIVGAVSKEKIVAAITKYLS